MIQPSGTSHTVDSADASDGVIAVSVGGILLASFEYKVDVALANGVVVDVRLGVDVGEEVKVLVGVYVNADVGNRLAVGVSVSVGVSVGISVRVRVSVGVSVNVAVSVGNSVKVSVTVGVLVGVALDVGISVGVGVTVGASPSIGKVVTGLVTVVTGNCLGVAFELDICSVVTLAVISRVGTDDSASTRVALPRPREVMVLTGAPLGVTVLGCKIGGAVLAVDMTVPLASGNNNVAVETPDVGKTDVSVGVWIPVTIASLVSPPSWSAGPVSSAKV